MGGTVRIDQEDDDDDLVISYQFEDGRKLCGDCKIGIYNGRRCKNLVHYEPFFNADKTSNPWRAGRGAYITSNTRRNSASFVEVYDGPGLRRIFAKYSPFSTQQRKMMKLLTTKGMQSGVEFLSLKERMNPGVKNHIF